MKKILLILSMIVMLFTALQVKSQTPPTDFTLAGRTVEMYDQIGPDFRYFETRREDVALYINPEENSFIIINGYTTAGIYVVFAYTKNNKVISQEDLPKMIKKNKVSYYIYQSVQTTNTNDFIFRVPVDLKRVSYLETENGKNYKYVFDIYEKYNGKPAVLKKDEKKNIR